MLAWGGCGVSGKVAAVFVREFAMLGRFWVGVSGFICLLGCSSAVAGSPLGVVCEFPDLSDVAPVPFQAGATAPAGTGGDVPGGRWELVAMYYQSDFAITATAVAALELDAETASSGFGSLALDVSVTSPTALDFNEAGAGPYAASGAFLSFGNDCGDELALAEVEYSVNDSGSVPVLTLWGELEFEVVIVFPVTIVVNLEAEFELVEPQVIEDPVFSDRFE